MDLGDLHPVILAGGLGTRLRHVLGDLPKPLAPVSGRPFLEWVIRYLHRQGSNRITLSVGYRAEAFEEFLRDRPLAGGHIGCIREPEPLGTAGGFLYSAHWLRAHGEQPPWGWLIMNGDSLVLTDLAAQVDAWLARQTSVAIVARHVADANRYGSLEVTETDHLVRFSEKAPEAKPGWINAGVYFIRHEMLERFPERQPLSFEFDVFPSWLEEGRAISVLRCDAPFLDIGTEQSLGQASEFISRNAAFFSAATPGEPRQTH